MTKHKLKIPIRIEGRGAIIGYCDAPPYGDSLFLPLIDKINPNSCCVEGDQMTAQCINTRITFDADKLCYWAKDYACLRSDRVEPY